MNSAGVRDDEASLQSPEVLGPLTDDKYFALDEHMKPEGYRVIADVLSTIVAEHAGVSTLIHSR